MTAHEVGSISNRTQLSICAVFKSQVEVILPSLGAYFRVEKKNIDVDVKKFVLKPHIDFSLAKIHQRNFKMYF